MRPASGATSPDSVITSPEPNPLPKPITTAARASVSAEPDSGTIAMPAPRMAMDGMAFARRETRSISTPAG